MQTVIEPDSSVKIIEFEVFKHYLAVVQERNGLREIRTVNLKTMREYVHMCDSEVELNPSDGHRAQFYDAQLHNNLTFDEVNLRYKLVTPNVPTRYISYNMGTKKATKVSQD